MLPIGVVIPTRNAVALLPDHLAAIQPWLAHVQEVLVVDSQSTDGTRELLRAQLHHPQLRFLDHPPGLYQSWNFGIRHLRAPFCYMSTVGETMSLAGLQHLADTAQKLACDVVISAPEFVDVHGRPMPAPEWPVHDLVRVMRLKEPLLLEGASLFLFTLLHYRNAILGSSASNLYRTSCLQAHPFPVDFGTVGDGAWGLQNCLRVRLGVTPHVFSTFREHPKSYAQSEYAVDALGRKLFEQVGRVYREHLARQPEFKNLAASLRIEEIFDLLQRHRQCQETLEASRQSSLPWIFQPSAWRARSARGAIQKQLDQLKQAALAKLRKD
ncbi:MAG TPA: glycosyltransferase family A protein [Clostridia bacterium]|nr:glycosyltransferase family A protein [Clostridia bacterium]